MKPILERALEHLGIVTNVSTGLTHPLDDSTAKELFKFLRSEGIYLDHTEIETWALKNQWLPRHAKQLAELAEKISSGGRVVIKHPGRLAAHIISELRALK